METIYVDLMIPAARRIGEFWDDDSVSFADVTIGLGRLQQIVRTLKWNPSHLEGPDHASPSALFAPVASEQHTFGLFIIEESFRRAGWRTWIETSGLEDDSVDMVRHHWFDLVGLSASSDDHTELAASTIAAMRRASRNRGLFVLVGGRLFIERPELVALVGADGTAPNGGEALLVANQAVRRLSSNA
jgi:methanogenic corrinoid protein MtbC1